MNGSCATQKLSIYKHRNIYRKKAMLLFYYFPPCKFPEMYTYNQKMFSGFIQMLILVLLKVTQKVEGQC